MFPGFEIFGKFISSYAIMTVLGILSAAPIAVQSYKKRSDGDDISMIFVLLFGGIGCFVGMHLLYGLVNINLWGSMFTVSTLEEFWEKFQIVLGGSVFYGGLFGGLIGGFISARVQKLKLGTVADCAAPSIALFHMFGRIGCFLGGCCYGVEWEYGVTFTESLAEGANGVPRVPVQLFEAGFELVMFVLLFMMLRKGVLKNKLLLVYLAAYAVGRFVLEFWRGDDYRGFLLGFSTSQLISIGVLVGMAVYFIGKKIKAAKQ